ncbi:MAG: phage/plasmid replication protein, II/X family [Gammaproteobacteria bacterium]|nr:phage/plasmid replication protein, II/X family [Gammaproteobacteria bacterium]
MIDWTTAILPCRHFELDADKVFKVSASGEVQWETACRIQVNGSYESSISVKSIDIDEREEGRTSHILISGNPSKFLQGHNVFGSDDILSLMLDVYLKITNILDLPVSTEDYLSVKAGEYPIKMIDINYSYGLPTRADVISVIRALEFKSKTRHGRPSMKGGTLYWGQSSARWALKAYSKGDEIEVKNHRLPLELTQTKLAHWADNKLRLELRLKSKELIDLGITQAKHLTTLKVQTLFNEYARRIDMHEQIALSDTREHDIPTRLKSTYILWKNGDDLRNILARATYYRHRKELLQYGINIDLREDKSPTRNVIPLIRILEAKPASIPDWAFQEKLIHHSARA